MPPRRPFSALQMPIPGCAPTRPPTKAPTPVNSPPEQNGVHAANNGLVAPVPLTTIAETPASTSAADSAFDLLDLFKRQFWLIAMCAAAGITAATLYSLNAEVWYTANAKILVSQRNAGATQNGFADGGTEKNFEQDVLDNHIEMVHSSRVLGEALQIGRAHV